MERKNLVEGESYGWRPGLYGTPREVVLLRLDPLTVRDYETRRGGGRAWEREITPRELLYPVREKTAWEKKERARKRAQQARLKQRRAVEKEERTRKKQTGQEVKARLEEAGFELRVLGNDLIFTPEMVQRLLDTHPDFQRAEASALEWVLKGGE